jgi:hypothetical protein
MIIVDFDITDELLITFSAHQIYQPFLDSLKSCDLFKREVLYNQIEFGGIN